MGWHTVLPLAVALSMDAFAVAVASGCALRAPKPAHYLAFAGCFGFFQFLMPVTGWALGASVRAWVEAWDHWLAFALLVLVGGNMIRQSLRELRNPAGAPPAVAAVNWRALLLLGVATSIDALAVGISMAFLQRPILGPAVCIGLVCAAITAVGLSLGRLFARIGALNSCAGIFGGLVLLAIAVNILREHRVFA